MTQNKLYVRLDEETINEIATRIYTLLESKNSGILDDSVMNQKDLCKFVLKTSPYKFHHYYSQLPGFPSPIITSAKRKMYQISEVKKWLRSNE